MNEFDQFIKNELKIKYYARYTDDFIIISENKSYLENLLTPIIAFLKENLKLELHPEKVEILKCTRGIDFLGYVIFPYYKLLRKKTLKRMIRKLKEKVIMHKRGSISKESLNQTFQSCLGVLSHANTYRLVENLKNKFWFWLHE